MAENVSRSELPNARKRTSLGDTIECQGTSKEIVQSTETSDNPPTPPLTADSTSVSPDQSEDAQRRGSPAPSSSTLSSIGTSCKAGAPSIQHPRNSSPGPPLKRRKLTVQEKEEQRIVKEIRERERAEQKQKKEEEKQRKEEEKQRKEEEKQRKDEEKCLKDEERRKKAEEREVKVREKELEKQRKEIEKTKKERSQMRLGAFFAKPRQQANPSPASTPVKEISSFDTSRRKSPSLDPSDAIEVPRTISASPRKTPAAAIISDYERTFLPYALPRFTALAPYNRFSRTREELDAQQQAFDCALTDQQQDDPGKVPTPVLSDTLHEFFPFKGHTRRGVPQFRAKDLVENLQGTLQRPVDLTGDENSIADYDESNLWASLVVKNLEYAEDVRPSYRGTYTTITSDRDIGRLRTNPFCHVRKDTDYDYDSEAEWEEPEEGEDLLTDGEEETESVGDADEMEGFLDDEDASSSLKTKKRLINGDLKPVSTGLCWDDRDGRTICEESSGDKGLNLEDMALGFLIDVPNACVDPFSGSYWEVQTAPPPAILDISAAEPVAQFKDGFLRPPRPPLHVRPNSVNEMTIVGAASGMKGPITAILLSCAPNKQLKSAQKRVLSAEGLAEFREAVQGSNLTKIDLIKALKKRFPKMTNEIIKDTLGSHAARVGVREIDKKWRYYSSPPPPSSSAYDESPHVTIIRPVKGLEPCLYDCLAATFRQRYPEDKLTIYFCVSDSNDPGLPILQRLIEDHPTFDVAILIEAQDPVLQDASGRSGLGPNPKIRNMSRAYREAKGDIVWIIDCNVWVGKGVCGRMVDILEDRNGRKKNKFVHQLPLVVDTAGTVTREEAPGWLTEDELHGGSGISSTSTANHGVRMTVPNTGSIWSLGGGRLEEIFMSSSHAKFYTAINTVLLAPCIVGKSNMFRRSHLNHLTDGRGIDFFSENICEDHLIGDLLWKKLVPEEEQGQRMGKHALAFGDLAIQPMAGMSVKEYVARRIRWLRVRKFTVTLATLVEPGTESLLCSLYGAFAVTTLPFFSRTFAVPQIWATSAIFWLLSVSIWAAMDWTLYNKLHSANSIEVDQNTPSFVRPPVGGKRRPFRQWLLAWLGREVLAFPVWFWAVFGGVTVTWRGTKMWVGMDMKVHEIAEGKQAGHVNRREPNGLVSAVKLKARKD
ncbi:Ceramide glucosyltransferase [Elasticomyces elasticus]|nr:Ceramide glucosyltransferase [Elasticomyces elasticus]